MHAHPGSTQQEHQAYAVGVMVMHAHVIQVRPSKNTRTELLLRVAPPYVDLALVILKTKCSNETLG